MRSSRSVATQLLRYGVVGVGGNAFGYLLYLGMTGAGLGPKLAATIAFAIVLLLGFVLNKSWTFNAGRVRRSFLRRYGIAYGTAYLLDIVGLYVFVDVMSYDHATVQGALIIAIAASLFVVQKLWVFNEASVTP